MRNITLFILLLFVTSVFGCAIPGDKKRRSYLTPYKYQQVLDIYEKTQSIDIVRRVLEDNNWYRSEINEAIYRLRKENMVIEKQDPLKL